MPPDSDAQTLEAQITADRIKQWKERRAKVAETSRNERLRLAEEERRARIKQAEEEREGRAKEAADRRARQVAQERADRLEAARAKLVGRAEIDAARERLVHYRSRSARAFVRRITGFILLPTALVAAYLFAVATPLYRAEAILSVQPPTRAEEPGGVFALPPATQAAHQVRAIMLSQDALAAVATAQDLGSHYGEGAMDPVRQVRDLEALQISQTDQLRRFISADIRAFEGLVSLTVHARSPEKAEAITYALIGETKVRLGTLAKESAPALATIVPPQADGLAKSPNRIAGVALAFLAFTALYAAGAILLATLRRHAWT